LVARPDATTVTEHEGVTKAGLGNEGDEGGIGGCAAGSLVARPDVTPERSERRSRPPLFVAFVTWTRPSCFTFACACACVHV
ncbi:MAG TPA: hypothetical protein VIV58_00370, partial [Kofleriaceae bacterium]